MPAEVTFLYSILAFLAAAVGVLFIFRLLKISSVLGYLVAGMLVGPHVLRIIENPTETYFLGQLGVIALLFTLGLGLPWQRLYALKNTLLGLGIPQVILTTGVLYFIGLQVGLSKEAAFLVGAALSLSSTAVVLQVLNDRQELATRFGRASFSILLFQDLMVVFLLILSTSLTETPSNIFYEVSYAILKAFLALGMIIVLGRFVFRPLFRLVSLRQNSELFMGATFLIVLAASCLTDTLGLSMELGAFLAGMLLAETEYRHQVEADIQPFRGLLLGVFFMSVGMQINLTVLQESFGTVMLLLGLTLAVKSSLLFVVSLVNGFRASTSLRVALILAGGGEFVFVIFSPSVAAQFLSPHFVDVLFLVVTLSIALTPFLAILAKALILLLRREEPYPEPTLASEDHGKLKDHIIIVGFGRVGQMLADILDARLIPYVAVDMDMDCIKAGRDKGCPVFYGDGRNVEILKVIGANQAKAVIVTVDHISPSTRVVKTVRRNFPDIPVCVRVLDHKHREKLLDSGAILIMPETVEPTIQLADSIFHLLQIPEEEVAELLTTFRRQQWLSAREKPHT